MVRKLPERHNHYLTEDVPSHFDLVSRRRLGRTKLTPKMAAAIPDGEVDPINYKSFDYAHLRAPLPKGIVSPIWGINKSSPSSYFLMRRSEDGYVSATGMFKATFPYATPEEEETERKYIKSLPTTSHKETAGNVWIPVEEALTLAEEYRILPWIQALLDPSDVSPNPGADGIASPPKYFGLPNLAPPTPARNTRSRRSASPTKSTIARRIASPRKRRVPASSQSSVTNEPTPSLTDSQAPTLINGDTSSQAPSFAIPTAKVSKVEDEVEGDSEVKIESIEKEPAVVLAPVVEEPKIKLHIDQDIKTDADGEEIKHTKVEVEVPIFGGQLPTSEEAVKMIAEATSMVEAATKNVSDEPAATSSKSKRKADDITQDEEVEDGAVVAPQAKKVKTEAEIRKEKIRKRAFFGLTATVAVGAAGALFPVLAPMISPYLANVL
ncbi:hypothetical protein QBC43DRAFT_39948 [Cladorrhinum sp. PSN259]|nr:hypothetical protein QBC43DRAFT_39948 [Cladorrhinum sp. PSN259]